MAKKFLVVEKRENLPNKLLNLFDIRLEKENIDISRSLWRFSYEDVKAVFDIPSFNKSLVDGFAVFSKSVRGSSAANPISLKLCKMLRIGENLGEKLERNETVFVPTGGIVPDGADSVIMVEYTEKRNGEIFFMKDSFPGENIAFKGDDFKTGEVILHRGEKITPNVISALRAFGIESVSVFEKIKIGIFSTGDELVKSGELPYGKIYDINEYSIFAEAESENFLPKMYGIVKDDRQAIKKMLERALSENDVVIMSGGTSKGTFDFTVSVINEIGKPGVLIHGLHLSPGKPTVFGIAENKLIVGLSGNPLASFLVFREVIIPLVYAKAGLKQKRIKIIATLSENLPSRKGREEFVPGKLFVKNGEQFVKPVFSESAFVSPLLKSDGVINVPLMSEGFLKGQKVAIELW